MSDSTRDSKLDAVAGEPQRAGKTEIVAMGSTTPSTELDAEPIMVGVGDGAAILDYVESVDAAPAPRVDHALTGYHFAKTVANLRDRATRKETGHSVPVRFDRRLFLPAHAERRRRMENDIRAMHGMPLRDGRTLRVEEVLGRYGELLGGTKQQLIEIKERLERGEEVRLAVSSASLSNNTLRQLGALNDRYGDRLRFFMEGSLIELDACRSRLIQETFLARIESARQRLLAGKTATLQIGSEAFVRMHHRDIAALRRRFGARLKIEVDSTADLSQRVLALLPHEEARTEPEHAVPPVDRSTVELAAVATHAEPQIELAREVAARIRKPWWKRTKWYRKLSRGSSTRD